MPACNRSKTKFLFPIFAFSSWGRTPDRGRCRVQGRKYRKCCFFSSELSERTAFFKAVSEGKRQFKAIAISGDAQDYLYPCGVCRQVMAEFCDPKTFQVLLVKPDGHFKKCTLEQLLPGAFTQNDLEKGIQ